MFKQIKQFFSCTLFLLLGFFLFNQLCGEAKTYYDDLRVRKYLKKFSEQNGISYKKNLELFKKVSVRNQKKESAIKNTVRPAEKVLYWNEYYPRFINKKNILVGNKFWQQHYQTLKRAEREFSVPMEIIVATIGIETNYGKNLGKYPVFASLVWLAFDGKVRKKFYLDQLGHLLLLRQQDEWFKKNFFSIKGSYSGAMGLGQFIPYSYRFLGLDYNLDGSINLINNVEDAIGSVAHYHKKAGWKNEKKVAVKIAPSNESIKNNKLGKNIVVVKIGKKNQQNKLVESKAYWQTFHNFKVIKRYNHNNYYALTLFLLSKELVKNRS